MGSVLQPVRITAITAVVSRLVMRMQKVPFVVVHVILMIFC
jgi:hypothetical protein